MGIHRLYIDGAGGLQEQAGAELAVSGPEARHAVRVKRVREDETVEVLNGAGAVATATVTRLARARETEWTIYLRVLSVRRVEPTRPRLEVWTAAPKGPRLSELIDGLSQAGAAGWRELRCERSGPRAKAERLRRVAAEAGKQSGRAWLMEIGEPVAFEAAVRAGGGGIVVADVSGARYEPRRAGVIRLLIGPEGGWSTDELRGARDAGAAVVAFGPHTMRIETAAVVASGIVLDQEARGA